MTDAGCRMKNKKLKMRSGEWKTKNDAPELTPPSFAGDSA
jgi:hypothetical protein